MKLIVVSAHPDDAETAAGGLIAMTVASGHEVVVLHGGPAVTDLMYGGRRSWDVRREESEAAARVLGARLVLFDWGHSHYAFNGETLAQLGAFLASESPDLVVAHWPIDTHPDHQVMGALAQQLCIRQRAWELAFFEVYAGVQALEFVPNRYADITAVLDRKNEAIRCHVSQDPDPQVSMHETMSRFRGIEFGVAHAEAFHLLGRSAGGAAEALFSPPRRYGSAAL